MNLSQTRPNLTKFDHTKSIQANLNQTKLKQTKQHHTNVTKIQASPLLSVCSILSTYKLTFPNRTYKLDQTKITINGFGMAKSAAQLLYGPVLVSIFTVLDKKIGNNFRLCEFSAELCPMTCWALQADSAVRVTVFLCLPGTG